jgi:hypothetical protein
LELQVTRDGTFSRAHDASTHSFPDRAWKFLQRRDKHVRT